MASFTDELVQFNPYVNQIPESYHQVGLVKQARYDEGVQRVQGFIDSVAGLEVMKDAHKQYITHRVTDLTSSLNRLASNTDFSNQSFVNQIGGYATKIAGDPIVQNAVSSTLAHKKNMQYIEDERKKGVDTSRNEWDYNKQLSEWLNDGDLRSSFSGRYSNVVDVMGEFYKAFKEAHPNSSLTQDAFRVDKDGKIAINEAMEETAYEGISPQQVQSIASTVFSRADVKNQLRIDGQFSYRGFDQKALAETTRENYQSIVDQTNKQIEDLRLKMTVDKTSDGVTISRQIEELKNAGSRIVNDYKDYASLIATNPEIAKAALYQNNLVSNLMKSFSWSKSSTKVVDNPLYKAQMDMMKYNLDISKYNLDVSTENRQAANDTLDYNIKSRELELKEIELGIKANKATGVKAGPGGADIHYGPRNIEEEQGKLSSTSFSQKLDQTKTQYSDIASEGVNMIAGVSGIVPPKIKDSQGRWIWNPAYSNTKKAEAQYNRIFNDSQAYYMEGKAGDVTKTLFTRLDPLKRTIQRMENTASIIDKDKTPVAAVAKELGNVSQDLIDYWVANNGDDTTAAAAKGRLKGRLGDSWEGNLSRRIQKGQSDEFGNISGRGTEASEYERIALLLKKNKQILPDLQAREERYKNAQVAMIPVQGDIIAGKPEEQRATTQLYASALGTLAEGNKSGVIKDMLDWTRDEKDEKISGNVYGGYYNRFSGKAYLTIRRGSESREAEVPVETFQSLGFKTDDPFWDTHGDDLAVSGNTTTGTDAIDAYPVPMPYGSKYEVKYHLSGTGNGNYAMRVFVYDEKGNKVLDGASYSPSGLGRYMTGSEVMTARQTLTNEAVIQGLINKSGKK